MGPPYIGIDGSVRPGLLSGFLVQKRIHAKTFFMCRNIKSLHNFAPAATDGEIRASSLQFVRKLCGFTRPSQANEDAFNRAVDEITHVAHHLLESLVTNAPPRNREVQRLKARARSEKRFGASNGAVVVALNHH